MTTRESLFPVSAEWVDGQLCQIGGVSLSAVADSFGTPLYIYDAATFQRNFKHLDKLLKEKYPGPYQIAYASKAYLSRKFAEKLVIAGTAIDVVSAGELNLALMAGMPSDRIHLHGNNKTEIEIRTAIHNRIESIVVDSLDELRYIERIAEEISLIPILWLRVNPNITVDTHAAVQTGHSASKFGIPIENGEASLAIRYALASKFVRLCGIHTHLGSQIFEAGRYRTALEGLIALCDENDWIPEVISPGGGWGVTYTEEMQAVDPAEWINEISETILERFSGTNSKLPLLVIEPGRWLVAQAGVAIYRVGATKRLPDGTQIVAVDGGLADNPRPSLYNSNYTAEWIGSSSSGESLPSRLVGRYCESGDELIRQISLPECKRGDLVVVPVSGAYQLSMASNYNLTGRPCVLWLEDGRVEVLQNRELIESSSWWMGVGG